MVSLRMIDRHITNITKKLEDDPADTRYILNVRRVGYKLTGVLIRTITVAQI
jgi:DNA-binding response OmpR family regulator